jgi:hypothetical protein
MREKLDVLNMYVVLLNQIEKKEKLHVVMCFSPVVKSTMYNKYTPTNTASALSPLQVNSGFTCFVPNLQVCVVFREEEFDKVLLHELMHAYNIDTAAIPMEEHVCDEIIKGIQEDFKLQGTRLVLNEGYNDTITCVCVIGFHELRKNPKLSLQAYLKAFEKQFRKQQRYIIDKAIHILKYYNFTSYTDRAPIFQNNTHVLSYYVTKAINFLCIDEFNDVLGRKIRMYDNPGGFCRYAQHLKRCLSSQAFEMEVNQGLSRLKNTNLSNLTLKMMDL